MTEARTAKRPAAQRVLDHLPLAPASSAMFFFRQFLADPRGVGAIVATSQAVVDALLSSIDWDRCRTIVEYGPGTGVFTRSILARGNSDLTVIAIDPSALFIEHLGRTLPDPRLRTVCGSAEDVEVIVGEHGGGRSVDYVVSGLPFSTLPAGIGERIVAGTERVLAPRGAFLVYQYSLFAKPLLDARFDIVDVDRVWRCLPPARIMRAQKGTT